MRPESASRERLRAVSLGHRVEVARSRGGNRGVGIHLQNARNPGQGKGRHGYWFRGQHELLMVATRGKMSPPAQPDRIGSVIRARRDSHSSKPDQVRDWIAKWYPNERKMEMFARPYTEMWPKHDGWETTNTTRGSAPGRLTLTVV